MEALSDIQKGGTSAFAGGSGSQKFTFVLHIGEDATVGNNKTNILTVPVAGTITRVSAVAKIAPVGSSLIMDINKNGASIWSTNQSNRIAIPSGSAGVAVQSVFDAPVLAQDDLLTIDIDQVGSTVPGQEITVTMVVS